MMPELGRVLQLGTLLHDVGELVALASSRSGAAMDHGLLGANWLQAFVEVGLPPGVPELAKARHSGEWEQIRKHNLPLLAYHADRWVGSAAISPPPAGEAGLERGPHVQSVFSCMGGDAAVLCPQPESLVAYPTAEPGCVDRTALVASFGEVFRRWVQGGCCPDVLLTLLERYWTALPSPTVDQPGAGPAPLFDAARLTCALASALYECYRSEGADIAGEPLAELASEELPDDKPYFALVAGRLFGGERFIDRTVAHGDVCTSLGRAFFVRLLSEHLADDVLGRLGLCSASAVLRADTEFLVLCPNVPALSEAVAAGVERVNRWLFDSYGSAMHWGIACVPAAGRDLGKAGFAGVLAALDREVQQQGGRPHRQCLDEILTAREPDLAAASCEVCGTDADPELASLSSRAPTVKACARCRELTEVGAGLMAALGVAAQVVPEPLSAPSQEPALLCFPQSDGTWVRYDLVKGDAVPGSVAWRYVFADVAPTSHAAGQARTLCFARYIRSSAHLPKSGRTGDKKRRHEAASLRALAKSARGTSWLGMLRLDVDGTAARVWAQATDLAHFATLSRSIGQFFGLHVPAICGANLAQGLAPSDVSEKRPQQAGGRNVTLVRSAGDDLLLVGAWDEVVEVALDIRECFRRYTAGGALTLSAAVSVGEPEAGWASLCRDSARALTAAKASGADRCALFYDSAAFARPSHVRGRSHGCHTWGQVQALVVSSVQSLKVAGRMVQNRFEAHMPHAFIRRLLGLAEQYEREGELYLPRMAYLVKQLREGKRGDLSQTQRLLMDASKMPGLRAACVWLTLLGGKV